MRFYVHNLKIFEYSWYFFIALYNEKKTALPKLPLDKHLQNKDNLQNIISRITEINLVTFQFLKNGALHTFPPINWNKLKTGH